MTMKLGTRAKIRVAKTLSYGLVGMRRLAGRTNIVRAHRQACNWELDLQEGIDLALYLGVYEPHIRRALPSLVRPGSVVIDVGANIGAQTLPMAHLAGSYGRIIAVEPTTYAFEKLLRNVSLNEGFDARVSAINAFLNTSVADVAPDVPSRWPLVATAGELEPTHLGQFESTATAQVLTLDTLVAEFSLPRVDLIKIDVDGNEAEVLGGAKQVLEVHEPDIIMEFAPHVHAHREQGFETFLHSVRTLPYTAYNLETRKLVKLQREEFDDGASRDLLLVANAKSSAVPI